MPGTELLVGQGMKSRSCAAWCGVIGSWGLLAEGYISAAAHCCLITLDATPCLTPRLICSPRSCRASNKNTAWMHQGRMPPREDAARDCFRRGDPGEPALYRAAVWNRQRTHFDLANTRLGHHQVQLWNLPAGWVIFARSAHPTIISEADCIAAQDATGISWLGCWPAAGIGLVQRQAANLSRHGCTSAASPDLRRPEDTHMRAHRMRRGQWPGYAWPGGGARRI
jgi:hypothetical protein